MIFVTVGTQLPFDRLIRDIDAWAEHRDVAVFAQVTDAGWRPKHIDWVASLDPTRYQEKIEAADLIVAHAGMGSIITALELGKRIIVVPRRSDLGEHRNDHQLATARRLERLGKIQVAYSKEELHERLESSSDPTADPISPYASEELLDAIRTFIDGQDPTRTRSQRTPGD